MNDDQQSFFDLPEGRRLRDEGMMLASDAERIRVWKANAQEALTRLAKTGNPFTADHLIAEVGLPGAGMNRSNAVGAIIAAAAKRGMIQRVGYSQAQRTKSHARTVTIWQGR